MSVEAYEALSGASVLKKTVSEVRPNVELIELSSAHGTVKKIYLVGTAHVSKQSAELVKMVIGDTQPDSVAIELCEPRYQSIQDPSRWRNTDVFQVIRDGKAYVLMAQLALAAFQKRLGDELDVKPGEEMRAAIEAAELYGADITLADRAVRTTLKRAWAQASLWSLIKVIFTLIASMFSKERADMEEIEKLKNADALNAMMEEFSDYLPGVKEVLIDERDLYLAKKIAESPGDSVVAVVGAGHVPGIKHVIGETIDLEPLERIPPPRKSVLALTWGIPLLILGMIAYGFVDAGAERSFEMIVAWVLANGVLAALGTLIALAHPITVITAFVAAPITSLNPMIAAGWVCGLVEAVVRKPRVADLETIADDISTVRGLWTNRVSKVLLVVIFANVGSSLGTFVGFGKIASLL